MRRKELRRPAPPGNVLSRWGSSASGRPRAPTSRTRPLHQGNPPADAPYTPHRPGADPSPAPRTHIQTHAPARRESEEPRSRGARRHSPPAGERPGARRQPCLGQVRVRAPRPGCVRPRRLRGPSRSSGVGDWAPHPLLWWLRGAVVSPRGSWEGGSRDSVCGSGARASLNPDPSRAGQRREWSGRAVLSSSVIYLPNYLLISIWTHG